ncbi:hypothetical protein UT300003_25380 [Clostridium sardiniense]
MKIYGMDERIEKQYNSANIVAYILIQIACIISLLIKTFTIDINLISIITEIFILVGCNLYIIVRCFILGISLKDLIKGMDEGIVTFRNKFISQSFKDAYIFTICIGVIYVFIFDNIYLSAFNGFIFFIPGLYVSYKYIKNGILIFGSIRKRNSKKVTLKEFKIRVVIGSIIFGLIMNGNEVYVDGSFHFTGIMMIFLSALLWGIPFYFIMKLMINTSEKNADKLSK